MIKLESFNLISRHVLLSVTALRPYLFYCTDLWKARFGSCLLPADRTSPVDQPQYQGAGTQEIGPVAGVMTSSTTMTPTILTARTSTALAPLTTGGGGGDLHSPPVVVRLAAAAASAVDQLR